MEKIKNNIGKIFIGICIGLAFFLGRTCSKDDIQYKDSTIIKHDTIWPDTIKVTEMVNLKGKNIHDTTYILAPYEVPIDSIKLRAFFQKRVYENNYGNDNAKIMVSDTVIGYLIGQRVFYRDFKPTSIVNSTMTTVLPQSTLITLPKWQIRGGFDATPKNLYLTGELALKKHNYNIGYDPFNKQFKVGYKYTILKSKK